MSNRAYIDPYTFTDHNGHKSFGFIAGDDYETYVEVGNADQFAHVPFILFEQVVKHAKYMDSEFSEFLEMATEGIGMHLANEWVDSETLVKWYGKCTTGERE